MPNSATTLIRLVGAKGWAKEHEREGKRERDAEKVRKRGERERE